MSAPADVAWSWPSDEEGLGFLENRDATPFGMVHKGKLPRTRPRSPEHLVLFRRQGLVTVEEYRQKRVEILSDL